MPSLLGDLGKEIPSHLEKEGEAVL